MQEEIFHIYGTRKALGGVGEKVLPGQSCHWHQDQGAHDLVGRPPGNTGTS